MRPVPCACVSRHANRTQPAHTHTPLTALAMADKCPWTRRSHGKDYPCSKGPFREPADAYEPYSPYCREHYKMHQRYQQKYATPRLLLLQTVVMAACLALAVR
jgi:hypothetical protein